ncbi:cellulase family glycosylhydrolase [Nocardioides sp. MAH-18]|uniref:Cellulase family glycosylhydrolase n=1 Tax=Nocardioides agri TaxID=2682843 RepID=A0A6L6XQZ7_9ACTN|nr:cellulase family glycosylhydrolase [Nocardioides sp. CGMCC 1.13656]MBA2954890.1 cellulase family glycosylhydrolase [Nocardioides sp. CGMCC 1.13656]MVQ49744.1 cellulase family glycosylhydrolase [Nocardioides sp. MAH-18]
MKRVTSLALSVLAAGAVLAGGLPATDAAAPHEPTVRAGTALPALHATHGRRAVIRSADGAQVLLRGVNVNGLAEYYQPNPAYPAVLDQDRGDFKRIARLGFNSVRLLVSWSELQPTRGAYDRAYVAKVRQAVRWAADYGMYSIIDMHQDAWGLAVDTPIGTACPEGTRPNNGWDGAPAWATITDGASTCTTLERELAPAVRAAWQHFYDDTAGIQGQLVRTWGRLARDFARDTNVAGFDLLNEPGFGDNLMDTTGLGRFYDRAITAIRRGERAGRGFSHIVFWEPSVMWSATGKWATPEPGFSRDRNLVFAPHVYSGSLNASTIPDGFKNAAEVAADHGVPVWSGEWGFFPSDPAESATKVEDYAAAEDERAYGGAWWVWEQACGNPHMIGAPGGQPGPISQSLVRFSCPGDKATGIPAEFGQVLSRPVPRAVPGRITELTSNGRTGRLELRGTYAAGADRCGLQVFVPQRFAGKRVRVTGVTEVRRTRHLGNVVLRGCVADRFRLRIG